MMEPAEAEAGGGPTDGYSLLDMLVALAIISVMAGLMAGFLGQLRPLLHMRADLSADAEAEAIADYLERAIGDALPLPVLDGPADRRLYLAGSPADLSFAAIVRTGTDAVALRDTRLSLRSGRLVQDFQPRRSGAEGQAVATSVEIATGALAITFRYLDHDPVSLDPVWSDAWSAEARLPAAVTFTLTLEREGRRKEVSGLAALPLAGPPQKPRED